MSQAHPLLPLSRRGFMHQAGALALVPALERLLPPFALPRREPYPPGAGGATEIDLRIAETSFGIGRQRGTATTINGSIPGPLLRLQEGEDVVLRVTNGLQEDTSIHWHGLLVPFDMDGVPGISFPGIKPGETFTYRFRIRQNGTYWYHSHSGLQEQTGVYGPIIIDPATPDSHSSDREYVVMLSDWTFENPHGLIGKLRKAAGYFNFARNTFFDLLRKSASREPMSLGERLEWGRMRMDPTDLADVSGHTYTYLLNGLPPEGNWTGLFQPGERVRLRFINAGAASFFDVRIPGLEMRVIQADGQDIQPVTVEELRIAIAETYDVLVQPQAGQAYTIFAESMDRSGYARGTLAPRDGMSAPIPDRRPRPNRTMADMGMDHEMVAPPEGAMPGMEEHAGHQMPALEPGQLAPPGSVPAMAIHGSDGHGRGNSMTPMQTKSRLDEPGVGLGNDGRRVLRYADLKSVTPFYDRRPPARELELHLTGNMERYLWSFDGKSYSNARVPIPFSFGERLRLTFVNDTMMEHPIHLHGMWMELENGQSGQLPRKHTVNVKPAERLSVLVTADAPGRWVIHCHILYHMEMGMFRAIEVTQPARAQESQ